MRLDKFTGINNAQDRVKVGLAGQVEAQNVDIDATGGRISRRKGYTNISAEVGCHSMFAYHGLTFYVQGSDLKRITSVSPFQSEIVQTISGTWGELSYVGVNNSVFYSDGVRTGVYRDGVSQTWGLVPPDSWNIVLSAFSGGGGLKTGRYMVTTTYVRSDGQESGATRSVFIDLAVDDLGISLAGLPVSTDPDVDIKNIYISTKDGTELYLALTLNNSVTSVDYRGDATEFTDSLKTQFKGQPPAGQIVSYLDGRVYVADGNVLYFSEAYNYDIFDEKSFIQFDAPITMVAPVSGGLYLSTEKQTMFIHRSDGEGALLLHRRGKMAAPPAIRGTAQTIDLGSTNQESPSGPADVLWVSKSGVYLGSAGGSYTNLTKGRYLPQGAPRGASMFIENDGMALYLAMLQQPVANAKRAVVRASIEKTKDYN